MLYVSDGRIIWLLGRLVSLLLRLRRIVLRESTISRRIHLRTRTRDHRRLLLLMLARRGGLSARCAERYRRWDGRRVIPNPRLRISVPIKITRETKRC